jgi:valyl-tRNA synthetase
MPQKELPKAYEPEKYEDEIYKKWEESGYFNPDNLPVDQGVKNYCIVMPPPNVTGVLHMGHAAMLAIQDILIRYHRMRGERVLWLPGTDHAAIATQTKVEKILKKEGLSRHDLSRENFLKRVQEFAKQSHDTIVGQVKKMGSSCDWSRESYTLDGVRTRAVRSVFKMMYDDGLIYRGERIVNWCPRCHSTLADDEVEYKTQITKFYTFRYDKNFPFTIATTRPETKLGDTAVAVNPKDERYKKYIGQTFEVNFVGVKLKIKIIADRAVDMEFGTGALGVTPAHSVVDWQMAEANNLPIVKVIDENGKIKNGFGEFSGQPVRQARKKIVEKLRAAGLLEKEEEIENNLSLCYRCETPIEPLPSKQWFIAVNKPVKKLGGKTIKEVAIEAVKKGLNGNPKKKINIYPQRFEKNYFHWLENLRDWCISRQIWFGHQIPVWYRKNSPTEIYVGTEPPKGESWTQDPDTLDTWFSSGLWTFSTLAHSPEQIKIRNNKLIIDSDDFYRFHPTAVLETGYDILFFWIARMIIMTIYAVGDIPFRDVYLHGLVLDKQGKKMSKSKGNVIDPLEMIKKYGTDATRLSLVIGSTPGNDLRLSEEKVAGFRNFTNKLWNIARYIITNYSLRITNCQFVVENFSAADAWILLKFQTLIKQVSEDLNNYRFSPAGEKLRDFTWGDLADWYLEISKFEKNSEKNKISLYILTNLLILWHPFIPFETEKIWQEMDKKNLLIIEKWPKGTITAEINQKFEIIKDIIVAIRNARAEHKVEPAHKIKAVIYAGQYQKLVKKNEILIKSLRTGIQELKIKEKGEKIKQAIFTTADEIEIYLLGAIDKEKEKTRLKKEISQLEQIIAASQNKLNNKNFINKAPQAIVNRERNKLAGRQKELKILKERLKKL